jgi:hypothetical protein
VIGQGICALCIPDLAGDRNLVAVGKLNAPYRMLLNPCVAETEMVVAEMELSSTADVVPS